MLLQFDPNLVYPTDDVGPFIDINGIVIKADKGVKKEGSFLLEEPIYVVVDTEYGNISGFARMQAEIGMKATIRVYDSGGGFYPDNTIRSIGKI